VSLPELIANSPTPGRSVAITTLASGQSSTTSLTFSMAGAAPAVLQAVGNGQFRAVIDSEIIVFDATQVSTGTWTALTRGAEGSTKATHLSGASVYHYLTAGALAAVYAQVGTDGTVGGPGGTDLTGSVVTASSLPPETGYVLKSTSTESNEGEWEPDSGGGSTPVLFGIGSQAPGAAMASFVNEGLGSMTPVASLFDGAPLGSFQGLVGSGAVLLAGTTPAAATFIGHDLSLIYRSDDGGETWTGQTTPWDADIGSGAFINAVAFGATEDIAVAVGQNADTSEVMLNTVDGGATWTVVVTPSDNEAVALSVAWDGTNWYYADLNAASLGSGLYSSPDLVSWTGLTTGIDGEEVGLVVATPSVVLAFTGSGTTATNAEGLSTDRGTTFSNPGSPFAETGLVNGIVTDGAGHWLAWYVPNVFSQSFDNGMTWATVDSPDFASEMAACFLEGTGWVILWGSSVTGGIPIIIYSAPVAEPLVITPIGYVPGNIYAPLALVPV
jgi:hypothetical protein